MTHYPSETRLTGVPKWLQSLRQRNIWQLLHVDKYLLAGLLTLVTFGLVVLFSASNDSVVVLQKQLIRLSIAFGVMCVVAQIPPNTLRRWAPPLYGFCIIMLLAVMFVGDVGKGAQRWLDFGFVRFQPSEILKLALPMVLAWYYHERPLPPSWRDLAVGAALILVPFFLVAEQPDLGTALLIAATGGSVLLLAGMSWRLIAGLVVGLALAFPIFWHFLHDYQHQRILTFLNPERDPLGAGYHIIQSKIAIGSGGWFGKGWLAGTQSHLNFLPENATDFIFSVCGEEFGLLGCFVLLVLYLYLTFRILYIALKAQNTFCRLLAGSLGIHFFMAYFINIGMVTGLLPVVGLPLPLVSYGGTSMVILMAAFGIVMSIQTHKGAFAK